MGPLTKTPVFLGQLVPRNNRLLLTKTDSSLHCGHTLPRRVQRLIQIWCLSPFNFPSLPVQKQIFIFILHSSVFFAVHPTVHAHTQKNTDFGIHRVRQLVMSARRKIFSFYQFYLRKPSALGDHRAAGSVCVFVCVCASECGPSGAPDYSASSLCYDN